MTITKITGCSILVFSVAYAVVKTWKKQAHRRGLRYPPGPKGLPLIGNLLDINIDTAWLTYAEWEKEYGGIIYVRLLGHDYVVINDRKIAEELLERRPLIYADRPYLCTTKLFGVNFSTGLMPYGEEWRLHRQMYNFGFNKQVSAEYRPMQMTQVHRLLQSLLATPQDYYKHLETFSGSVIMSIVYGYDAAPRDDPFVAKALRLMAIFMAVLNPEHAALLGSFPILSYIPSWLPGGRYKQHAEECRVLARQVLDDPLRYVKDSMASGLARKSLVCDLLRNQVGRSTDCDREEAIKEVAATSFVAGAETTFSTLLVFILAMVLFPEVQAKAQEEIDRVVGRERLPDFNDRMNMPYVEAVVLETMRWYPVVPLGLPHMTTEDDVFDGMYIPKGTTVTINVWAIAYDKKRFTEPEIFNPCRHLTQSGKIAEDTSSPVFGLGRRICPGRHVADQSIWAAIVSILATFRIGKEKDEYDNEIDVVPEFTTGAGQHPKRFPCSIKPRSSKTMQMILAACSTE